ncbi:hypothetical protein Mapa_015002 [Marchantia paleacea]|nr:hypothetical protein Mapa_015002 [Marchantia paleacea]
MHSVRRLSCSRLNRSRIERTTCHPTPTTPALSLLLACIEKGTTPNKKESCRDGAMRWTASRRCRYCEGFSLRFMGGANRIKISTSACTTLPPFLLPALGIWCI